MFNLFRRTYHTKRDAEIEIFFKHVNWYKLLHVWGLFPTFAEARDTIWILRGEQEHIRKTWHDNPATSLAQILASMDLLPIKKIAKGNDNSEWYFASIEDLMAIMGIPEREFRLWTSMYNIFGFKRKYPKVTLVKDLSTCHIKRILKNQRNGMTSRFARFLVEELKRREK